MKQVAYGQVAKFLVIAVNKGKYGVLLERLGSILEGLGAILEAPGRLQGVEHIGISRSTGLEVHEGMHVGIYVCLCIYIYKFMYMYV